MADLAPGDVIGGRYRIEDAIGGGAYGKVYRATLLFSGEQGGPPMGREVAIKVLDSAHKDGAQRFAREAAIARRLEHPNTVRLFEFGSTEQGKPFLVMELLRGRTLEDILNKDGPLPVADALQITRQVLASLAEAHDQGIIHRDLKPANVFVTSHAGEPLFVKVLDFGLAKDLLGRVTGPRGTRYPALTRMGEVMGTPTYMAPEQATNQPLSPRTDLYAVGLVLAEMIHGKPLVVGANVAEILLKQARGTSVPLPPSVARTIAGPIAHRALAKRADQRYASAHAMLRDVQQALSPQTGPSAAPAVSLGRPALVGIAVALGVLLSLSVIALLLLARGDDKSAGARRSREDDSEEEEAPKKKRRATASASASGSGAPRVSPISPWTPSAIPTMELTRNAPLDPPRSYAVSDVEAALRRDGYTITSRQNWTDGDNSGTQFSVERAACFGAVVVDHRPGTAAFIANGYNIAPGARAFSTEDDVIAIVLYSRADPTVASYGCSDPAAATIAR